MKRFNTWLGECERHQTSPTADRGGSAADCCGAAEDNKIHGNGSDRKRGSADKGRCNDGTSTLKSCESNDVPVRGAAGGGGNGELVGNRRGSDPDETMASSSSYGSDSDNHLKSVLPVPESKKTSTASAKPQDVVSSGGNRGFAHEQLGVHAAMTTFDTYDYWKVPNGYSNLSSVWNTPPIQKGDVMMSGAFDIGINVAEAPAASSTCEASFACANTSLSLLQQERGIGGLYGSSVASCRDANDNYLGSVKWNHGLSCDYSTNGRFNCLGDPNVMHKEDVSVFYPRVSNANSDTFTNCSVTVTPVNNMFSELKGIVSPSYSISTSQPSACENPTSYTHSSFRRESFSANHWNDSTPVPKQSRRNLNSQWASWPTNNTGSNGCQKTSQVSIGSSQHQCFEDSTNTGHEERMKKTTGQQYQHLGDDNKADKTMANSSNNTKDGCKNLHETLNKSSSAYLNGTSKLENIWQAKTTDHQLDTFKECLNEGAFNTKDAFSYDVNYPQMQHSLETHNNASRDFLSRAWGNNDQQQLSKQHYTAATPLPSLPADIPTGSLVAQPQAVATLLDPQQQEQMALLNILAGLSIQQQPGHSPLVDDVHVKVVATHHVPPHLGVMYYNTMPDGHIQDHQYFPDVMNNRSGGGWSSGIGGCSVGSTPIKGYNEVPSFSPPSSHERESDLVSLMRELAIMQQPAADEPSSIFYDPRYSSPNNKGGPYAPQNIPGVGGYTTGASNPGGNTSYTAGVNVPALNTSGGVHQSYGSAGGMNCFTSPSPLNLSCTPLSTPTKGCVFCKNNNYHSTFYKSHMLKDERGHCSCPVLRTYVCPLCRGTGDAAHTLKYCPLNTVTRGDPIATGLPPGKVTNWRDVANKMAHLNQYGG